MGKLSYFARDLYPESGLMETSLLAVPSETEQRTLETDEAATKNTAAVQSGGTKSGMFGTVAVIIGIIAVFAILTK